MFSSNSLISFIKDIVYYGYILSFNTGKFLVNLIETTAGQFITIIRSLLTFISILNESITVFINDIATGVSTVIHGIYQITEHILNILMVTANGIFGLLNGILSFYNLIISTIAGIVFNIGQLFIFIKRIIILFGSGIWFAVTLIPLFFFYCGTMFIYFLGRLIDEFCTLIVSTINSCSIIALNIFNFIFDVPLESLAGILTLVSIAFIIVQFYVIIVEYLKENMISMYHSVKRVFNRLVRKIMQVIRNPNFTRRSIQQPIPIPVSESITRSIQRPKIQARPHIRSFSVDPAVNGNMDGACVICEEHRKCILLLPCKHVCMCSRCSQRLQNYNNKCPICRTNIENSMKIFI